MQIAKNKSKALESAIVTDQRASRFVFINASQESPNVDIKSRSLIRRHVKRNGLRRKETSISLTEKTPEVIARDEQTAALASQFLFGIPQLDGVDPFEISPIQLQPYMLDLLSYCMCSEKSRKNFYVSAIRIH